MPRNHLFEHCHLKTRAWHPTRDSTNGVGVAGVNGAVTSNSIGTVSCPCMAAVFLNANTRKTACGVVAAYVGGVKYMAASLIQIAHLPAYGIV